MIVEKIKSYFDNILDSVSRMLIAYEGSLLVFLKQKKQHVIKVIALVAIVIGGYFSYSYYKKIQNAKQMDLYIAMMAEVNKETDIVKKVDIIPLYIDKLKGNIKIMASLEAAFLYLENRNLDKAVEILYSTLKKVCCVDRSLKNNLIIHTSSLLIEKADNKSLNNAFCMLSKIRKKDRGFYQLALQKKVIIKTMLDNKAEVEKILIDFEKTIGNDKYPSVFNQNNVKDLRYFIDNYKQKNENINIAKQ